MFVEFFFFLRRNGLKVSINEWLDLLRALQTGLAGGSLMGFYGLCRCLVVKHENDFDLFDRCFAAYFQGTEVTPETFDLIHDELMSWLQNALQRPALSEEEMARLKRLDPEEIRRMFEERLREQKERHDGGNRWIGTGGTSPFGHSGYHPSGIRVGGDSRLRSALQIATARRFQNLRSDLVLDTRQMGLALKKLRILGQIGAREELDVEESVKQAGKNAGDIELIFKKSRKNTVKLLLLTDAGGSMTPHSHLCSRLFSAASAVSHFKAFRHYYFHNCPYDFLFSDIQRMDRIDTEEVLAGVDESWHLMVVGDAAMNPYELLAPGGCIDYFYHNEKPGLWWLEKIKKRVPAAVWLNPEPPAWWQIDSCRIVRSVFTDMFPLTLDGLTTAVETLKSTRPLAK